MGIRIFLAVTFTVMVFSTAIEAATGVTRRSLKMAEDATCSCSGFITKYSMVCGSDDKNYTNACDLAEYMKNNRTVGLKYSHPCPDPERPLAATRIACTPTNRIALPARRSLVKKVHVVRNRQFETRLVKKFCLTDGSEWHRNTIFCALKQAPRGVGIRCMGFCRDCKKMNDACPGKLLQKIPAMDEAS